MNVIIYDQGSQVCEIFQALHLFRLIYNAELEGYHKFGSLSLFAFYHNRSIHHVHNIFCNRKPQPCSMYPADRGGALPFKRFKQMLQKIPAHADAGILYLKLIRSVSLRRIIRLNNLYAYGAAWLCIFHGIAQNI